MALHSSMMMVHQNEVSAMVSALTRVVVGLRRWNFVPDDDDSLGRQSNWNPDPAELSGDNRPSPSSNFGGASNLGVPDDGFSDEDTPSGASLAMDSVKLMIKVPEFFVEIPKSSTVSFLKRKIMSEVTALLESNLHVGDNITLLQAGISHDSRLEITLEPTPSARLPSLSPNNCSFQFSYNVPHSLKRHAPIPDLVQLGSSDFHTDSSCDLLEDVICVTDPVNNKMNLMVSECPTASTEVACHPSTNAEVLNFGSLHQNSKVSKNVQHRRNPKPFSVSEVKILVTAVEELGTGRISGELL